ncbi:polysaccharide deacetylase family protein [Rhodoligotrophos defluvii]|uniref:polysaccharide deacetylase family protein n=1 Tax=Rhodoligotrophos defluvii TaxID=2561934 RepID=UPI001EF10247|nr:polysaccharide deacetylase family protein [Rhodoligotrophos defluvii]
MQDPRLPQLALSAMRISGLSKLAAPLFRGLGAIFMLHHIFPGGGLRRGFAPNRGLEVTPEFLAAVIHHMRDEDYELIALGDAVERIRRGHSERPFAVFTIDDGYKDNLEYAVPIFRGDGVPYTIFFAPEITDGKCELWWRILEEVIRRENRIAAQLPSGRTELDTATDEGKNRAFRTLYWPVRHMEEHEQRRWIRRFARDHGFDVDGYCRSVAMGWTDVRALAQDPLCTIGAHTIHHYAVAKLSPEEALAEMAGSADRIAVETGVRPQFLAYPYGDEGSAGPRDFALAKQAGFAAAVTTAKGVVHARHAGMLTGLPRVSLNGDYQRLAYVDVLVSGLPFAARDAARKLLGRG